MAITSILAHQLISEIEMNLFHPITIAYQCKEWDESFKHKYIFKIHLKIHSSCVLVKSFAFLFLVSLYNYDLFKKIQKLSFKFTSKIMSSVTTKLHCISAYKLNQPQRKICKVISGTLKAKFSNKVLSKFQQRYVELIYVEKKLNQNVTTGHYEMRLYKNNNKSIKSSKDLFCFKINPMSMTFYANNITSDKHPFTFVCSSNGISICFSVHTKYECNGWISVLQQLQWQYQPHLSNNITQSNTSNELNAIDESYSNITPQTSMVKDDENHIEHHITYTAADDKNRCTILGLLNDSY